MPPFIVTYIYGRVIRAIPAAQGHIDNEQALFCRQPLEKSAVDLKGGHYLRFALQRAASGFVELFLQPFLHRLSRADIKEFLLELSPTRTG